MGTTAIYVRQSEDKTGHAAAVARQEQDCRLLARAKGWPEPTLYSDNDRSATNGKARPEFERLLRAVAAGEVRELAVWHLDRLTRSMRDLGRLIEAGREHRVNIASVHGVSLDLGDPTGVAVAQILTAIAAMETAHKSERQRRANRQRAESGNAYWTRRPFGYDRDKGGVHIVAAEAAAIRDGAQKILAGATLSSVVREWNAAGLRTTFRRRDADTRERAPEGGPWGVTQLRRVMINPRYAGQRVYNGEDMGEGAWEPILDPETFRELEEKLTDPSRRVAPDDLTAKHLLSGIAVCGKCGGAMFAATMKGRGGTVPVLRCFGGYCMQRRRDLVEEVVEATLLARLALPDAARALGQRADLATLRGTAADLRERRDAIAAMLADGLLSPAAARQQATKVSAALAAAERAVSDAEGANPVAGLIAARDIAAAWERLEVGDQRRIVRALMTVTVLPAGKGVRFDPDQVRIDWKEAQS
jgi:DNA invertase Pin-like site-specific DNA recombinase